MSHSVHLSQGKNFQGVNETGSISISTIILQLGPGRKRKRRTSCSENVMEHISWSQQTFKQLFDIVLAAFWWLPLKLENQIAKSAGMQRCQLPAPQLNVEHKNSFSTSRILIDHLKQKP